jgi:transposase
MRLFSPTTLERALKIQEVILRAQRGEIKWKQAASMLGLSPRTLRRWHKRYLEFGQQGLVDQRGCRPSPKAATQEERNTVLDLYATKYQGFNVRHFHEIAQREHGMTRSYSFVKSVLQESGFVKKRKARGRHHKRREPKASFGEMIHIDGSPHEWLALRPGEEQVMIDIVDDATSKVLYAQLWPAETAEAVLSALKDVFTRHGLPMSAYTDRAGWAFYTPKAGGKVDKSRLTQVGRALARLGVEHIPAYTPQARGRGERCHGTLQDRLVNELKAAGIADLDTANVYIREKYLPQHNENFARKPRDPESVFVSADGFDLDQILCIEVERVVNSDNTVRFNNAHLQIEKQPGRASCAGLRVAVRLHLDGAMSVWRDSTLLGKYEIANEPEELLIDFAEMEYECWGFQGMEGSRMFANEERSPKAPPRDIPSPSPDYPSAGCSPAEPASVSSGCRSV